MTPHPLRCETCGYFEKPPNLQGYFGYCNIIDSEDNSIELTETEINLHKKWGCASHSSSRPAPPAPEFTEEIVVKLVAEGFDRGVVVGEEAGAKSERARVLDEALERFENDKSRYTGDHIHRVLESLRSEQEKER